LGDRITSNTKRKAKALSSKLRAGDWVEVRSKEEILTTLDQHGTLDGLPFMPEMLAFCGKQFQVYKRAHKTCDTVFPVRGRRMADAAHLETRCDGQAHGGCQAGCLLFWKKAWLKRVDEGGGNRTAPDSTAIRGVSGSQTDGGCSEDELVAATRATGQNNEHEPVFVCQATRLPYATTNLEWWDIRQYVEDYTSGNVGLGRIATGFIYMGFRQLINLGIGLGGPLRWVYDAFQGLVGGVPYPRRAGKIPTGTETPVATLNLQPGELVRVKSYEEILGTCAKSLANRGMYFDAEMVPYCGKTYRVLKRVTEIINEKTGKMLEMKTPCVILESVVCQARYSECRLFCPRSIYSYWREIWLRRIPDKELARVLEPQNSL
jgi:hypothetical protein